MVLAYNGLITSRNRTQEAWSEIDVELKRRHDLIPNLVETVKGYAGHERHTFEAVTNARASAVAAGATRDPGKIDAAEDLLSQSLRSLFAVAENYPQLRAVESFAQLQEQLTATEDKLDYARRYYNTSVRDYNISLQTFPRSVLAGTFGFKAVTFLETAEADRAAPQVSFDSPALPTGQALTSGARLILAVSGAEPADPTGADQPRHSAGGQAFGFCASLHYDANNG